MNIGFVGIILNDKNGNDIKMKRCILKNASEENLMSLIKYNLCILDQAVDYLIQNDLHLFRISSDIIPFASHIVNKIKWWEVFKKDFDKIGKKAIKNKIRLSMHPGQYTIINTDNPTLFQKSVDELIYHTRVLDCLGFEKSSKVILHIGGVYGNKEQSIKKFIENFKKLPNEVKSRLVIENDDKNYTASDVLRISKEIKVPVVLDYLHYLVKHYDYEDDFVNLFDQCRKTWKKSDGVQKIHYSEQAVGKKLGSHSQTINPNLFYEFSKTLPYETDVMFEVKDKNLSVIKYKEFLKNISKK